MRWSLLLVSLGFAAAENGLNGWLRYAPIANADRFNGNLPSTIVALNSTTSSPVYTAGKELQQGINSIFSKDVELTWKKNTGIASSLVVGTVAQYKAAGGDTKGVPELENDGYWLSIDNRKASVLIIGQNERGALYGAFKYLSMLAQGDNSRGQWTSNPDAPIRWTNEWNNLISTGTHGSVERGYGGPSIFFKDGEIKTDLTRVAQYARLLASIGINGIVVNNVNANASFLLPSYMDGLARIADVFRPYGINMGISLFFASPRDLGGLSTFDPLDPGVIAWWHQKTEDLYARIPDFAGYLIKANSEGQPGPFTYNRTLAEGANLFAKALKPHGGVVMFRAFVYDSQNLNENNWKDDRANAAVHYFQPLDGKFDDNVVVQIKYGPIDFQVREPTSPLFANLLHTNTAIELQISQEYLGQQCHLVYLPPLWKTILDDDLRVEGKQSYTKDIVSGKRFNRPLGGYAGVSNVGTNTTWLGSHLAMSNLYAFGRLAWDPSSDSVEILQDWIRLTFGQDRKVINTITDMSMASWPAYEDYTGNLGIQTLTDILFGHYGPKPQSQDNNPWGQWTRADADSIGMDRTVKNGTGFAGQYPPEVAARYESLDTTPDDLLLWFHHVPYTQKLHSGETVIQHFYDAHYSGAAIANTFPTQWEELEGKIDTERYNEVLFRLKYQGGHSITWRDAITTFYYNVSGIPDDKNRVGNYKYRIEAESMTLDGYKIVDVDPFETASKFKAIQATSMATATASTKINFATGTYDLAVNYFDQAIGKATWQVYLNDKKIGEWMGDSEYGKLGHAPSFYLDGHSATRIIFEGVRIAKGDTLKIVGMPDGQEMAALDYVSLLPVGVRD